MTATTSPDAPTSASAVAARVGQALQECNLSQVDAARCIGIDKTKLSKSLSGSRRFRIEELSAIAELTAVSLDWLTRGAGAFAPAAEMASTPTDDRLSAAAAEAPRTGVLGGTGSAGGPEPASAAAAASKPTPAVGGAKAQRMRTRIADAAWRLFSEWGYHRVRMIDIATRAGISAAGLHYHYTSKQEVFVAALQHSAARLRRERAALLERAPQHTPVDHVQLLHALIALKLPDGFATRITDAESSTVLAGDWSIWLQNFAELAVGAGSRDAASTLAAAWDDVLADCLAAGQTAGAFTVSAPVEAAAQLTIFLDGLVLRTLAGAADDPHTLINRYLAATILAPAPTGSAGVPAPADGAGDSVPTGSAGAPALPEDPVHIAPAPPERPATPKGEPAS